MCVRVCKCVCVYVRSCLLTRLSNNVANVNFDFMVKIRQNQGPCSTIGYIPYNCWRRCWYHKTLASGLCHCARLFTLLGAIQLSLNSKLVNWLLSIPFTGQEVSLWGLGKAGQAVTTFKVRVCVCVCVRVCVCVCVCEHIYMCTCVNAYASTYLYV